MSPTPPRPPRQSLAALLRTPGPGTASAPAADAVIDDAAAQQVDAADPATDWPPPSAAPAAGPVLAAEDSAPAFARRDHGNLRPPRWQWALVAGLGVLLAAQVVLADRARLAADAGTRPLVETLCGLLGCSLPAWQEAEAFSMLDRSVLPLPGHPGVLAVEASFRNDARWGQALPLIELTLSTADGQVSGQRIFTPAEYLDGPAPARLAPGQSVNARLLLAEPGNPAEAFHFRFR